MNNPKTKSPTTSQRLLKSSPWLMLIIVALVGILLFFISGRLVRQQRSAEQNPPANQEEARILAEERINRFLTRQQLDSQSFTQIEVIRDTPLPENPNNAGVIPYTFVYKVESLPGESIAVYIYDKGRIGLHRRRQ